MDSRFSTPLISIPLRRGLPGITLDRFLELYPNTRCFISNGLNFRNFIVDRGLRVPR